jgi:hypothetical protein
MHAIDRDTEPRTEKFKDKHLNVSDATSSGLD